MTQKKQTEIVEFSRDEAEAYLKIVDDAVSLLHAKIKSKQKEKGGAYDLPIF